MTGCAARAQNGPASTGKPNQFIVLVEIGQTKVA